MTRGAYARQIEGLRDDLLRMGSMVEHALEQALRSLETWDTAIANQIISNDENIDASWHDLESKAVRMLATQQPIVATDLRFTTTVMTVAGELERIGDYANHIARRVRRASRRSSIVPPPAQIHDLHRLALQMLHTSLDALLRQDVAIAESLGRHDEQVDSIVDTVREELLAIARADGQKVDAVVDLLDVVTALERTADRATNIGERVIYLVTSSTQTLN